ncbi:MULTISPECIES: Fpg/Nei family DNA glycosylase [Streptomyces]|uniref:Fpg/Nei family DNA glycosylase n=1 Tax=Streptomyces TaxID=1883 RepID=UPI000CD4DAAC|nr:MULTISPECIES: DNA-formamidopyrimidine glycosylase family protein [Streptomyces]
MPEGHTIHRLAADLDERFGGGPVRAASPQGRFADGAALIDGHRLTAAEAHGKHLFLGFDAAPADGTGTPATGRGTRWVHIHLGLYGKVTFGTGEPPPPRGQVRLRLASDGHWAELRGPNTCELITRGEKQQLHQRLGPDPLRDDADPAVAYDRLTRSSVAVAALLLDQKIIAGVGNVYRAEVLFRRHLDPYLPGRALTRPEWDAVWADLVELLHAGVRANRIDTVRPEHTPQAMGRDPRVDGHGGEVYVYRRAHKPCLVCGTPVRTAPLLGRNLFWCPTCQPPR